jgi:ribosomal protein S18 acetylase RimI-like enzyme
VLIEVKEKDKKIKQLITYCIGFPTEEKVNTKLDEYFSSETLTLFCTKDFSGLIGIGVDNDNRIEILHIAVDPENRKRSIGKRMIEEISAIKKCSTLYLETSDNAVDFYRKCGFSAKSLGEKYPGVVRYYCERMERSK